jgi:hypothetical protein
LKLRIWRATREEHDEDYIDEGSGQLEEEEDVVRGLQVGAQAEHGQDGRDEKDVERLLLRASDHEAS